MLVVSLKKTNLYILTKYFIALFILSVVSSCTAMKIDNRLSQANDMALDGLYKEAIYQYELILNDYPQSSVVHRNLGIVLVRIGLYHKAFQHLQQAHKDFSKEFQTNFYLAETFRLFKDWDRAISHYQTALKAKANNYRASRGLAWTYYYNGEYRKGLSVISSVPSSKQNDPQVAIIKARLNIKLRNFGAAFALMQQQRFKEDKNKVFLPYVYSVLGDIYFERERLDKAMEYFKLALSLRPHLSSGLIGQGKILFLNQKYTQAAKLFIRAYSLNPDLSEPYYYLAKIYEPNDPQRAMRYYQKFVKTAQYDTNFNFLLSDVEDNIAYLEKKVLARKNRNTNRALENDSEIAISNRSQMNSSSNQKTIHSQSTSSK